MRGEIVVEVRLLRKEADLRFDLGISPVVTQNASRAAGRENKPHKHLQRGCFSRAVGSEKAEDLAVLNCEMKRLQRAFGALLPEAHHVGFF